MSVQGAPRHGAAEAPIADSRAAPATVSIVAADRMCTGCGHNLYGQIVLREPHYGLLIARCPECGAAAAMQEYPLLGRWANRIGMVLAALCVVLAVAAAVLSAIALGAISYAIGEESGSRLTDLVEADFARWTTANLPGKSHWQVRSTPEGLKWWTDQGGLDGFVAAHGGWSAMINWSAALLWIPSALAALGIGVFWSIAMLGLPRRKLWRIACVVLVLAAAVVGFIALMHVDFMGVYEWMNHVYAARRVRIALVMAALTLLVLAPFLVVGLWIGRPIARCAVRIFLPPRFRGVLSILWTSDGLPLPHRRA